MSPHGVGPIDAITIDTLDVARAARQPDGTVYGLVKGPLGHASFWRQEPETY